MARPAYEEFTYQMPMIGVFSDLLDYTKSQSRSFVFFRKFVLCVESSIVLLRALLSHMAPVRLPHISNMEFFDKSQNKHHFEPTVGSITNHKIERQPQPECISSTELAFFIASTIKQRFTHNGEQRLFEPTAAIAGRPPIVYPHVGDVVQTDSLSGTLMDGHIIKF
ncbi:hypothetical protein BDR07DRAFT_1381166 [Suillus spraguei]|nr:hypothetical protein BDR07DRAFT_1381166 [Suillus spraguei]